MDRAFVWKKLQYFRAIARVQYDYREFLSGSDEVRDFKQGLRRSEVLEEIRSLRTRLQTERSMRHLRQAMMARVLNYIKSIAGITSDSRKKCIVSVGGKPHGEQVFARGVYDYRIRVGWMWEHKVKNTLYIDDCFFEKWLLLSAEKIRVNSAEMVLYEVKAFHLNTGQVTSGYVAQTKTDKKISRFGKTAAIAVRNAEARLQEVINKALTKEQTHD